MKNDLPRCKIKLYIGPVQLPSPFAIYRSEITHTFTLQTPIVSFALMNLSIIARYLPLIFFFNIVSFPLLHGQLPQPITSPLPTQQHQVYIVHVQKPAGKKFHLFKYRKDWYQSFLPNNTLFSGKPRLVYAYRQVITGFSAWLTKDELKVMESMEGFLLARKNTILQHRTTYTPKFLGLDRTQGMWYESWYGQGQIIGVFDTGVKPTHPSFKDHLMSPPPTKWNGNCYWGKPICNNKLVGAKNVRFGSATPLDTAGHGSHCASIAAGNFVDDANVLGQARGTAAGLAPKAHLAIYKVDEVDDYLKAMENAIHDHVDVLSISLGDNHPEFYRNGLVIGSFTAAANDIVPCLAAPNEGPTKSSMDNDAPWIVTIGAASTDRRIMATVKLGDTKEFNGESAYQPSNYGSPQLPLANVISCTKNKLHNHKIDGKIVLCGQEANDTRVGELVKNAGGAALIIIGFIGNTTVVSPHVLPASIITSYAGEQIIEYSISTPNPTASIIFKGTQFGVKPSPAVAAFSGRGPSNWNGGLIKPDVIAPGVNILAAWPFEIGLNHTGTHLIFAFESGCSMATPHVAGLAALLKGNHPTWSVAAIRSAIMTTASTLDQDGNPISDQYNGKKASIFDRGSGHIDPVAANDPGLIYDIQHHDYIRYLCGSGLFNDKQVNTIIRGNITCSTIRSIKVEDLNYPSIGISLGTNSDVKIVSRTVTNVGDADTTFNYKSVPMPKGEVSEGQLSWDSGKYLVRIPIAVTSVVTFRTQKAAHFNIMGHNEVI